MMVIGIGTDIVEIARIQKMYGKHPAAFAERLLTEHERIELSTKKFPEKFLAKRWALKEAISKALGTGIAQGVSFLDMEISHTQLGAPVVNLTGRSKIRADELGIQNWQISVSDEVHYCVAFAMAQGEFQSE